MCSVTVRGESSHEFQSRSTACEMQQQIKIYTYSQEIRFKIDKIKEESIQTSPRCCLVCTTFTLVSTSHSAYDGFRRREKQHSARRTNPINDNKKALKRANMWIKIIIFLRQQFKMSISFVYDKVFSPDEPDRINERKKNKQIM